MKLSHQKRLSAKVLKCSPKRVKLDPQRLEEVKEAITKSDINSLIKDKAIKRIPKKSTSKVRARKRKIQYAKGKRKGHGSRKGKQNARLNIKTEWRLKIRAQRAYITELRDSGKIEVRTYRDLYRKSKGGFFRSKRHIQLFIEERGLKK
ncbi:50S ribosomal protein L19e [Nanoarchaeota archaeon]